MKPILVCCMVFIALVLVWFTAGKLFKEEKVEDWITGVYTQVFNNEFSKGADTLVVIKQGAGQFRIKRRVGFRRILDGKVFDPEYKTEDWIGILNENTQQIWEQQQGRVLSFQKGKMWVGTSEYQKLK